MKTHEIEKISETLGGNLGRAHSRRRRTIHTQGPALRSRARFTKIIASNRFTSCRTVRFRSESFPTSHESLKSVPS
jgi:hypothetical protein